MLRLDCFGRSVVAALSNGISVRSPDERSDIRERPSITAVPHIACARGLLFEQIAPERVSGYAQNGTLICRADANATADAGFDPADPAFYAVGGQGNDVAGPSVANKPVEGGTS
jgi:hypothetical protein